MSVSTKLTAIADAIRAKTGGTDKLTLDEMLIAIESIETVSSGLVISNATINTVTIGENNVTNTLDAYDYFGIGKKATLILLNDQVSTNNQIVEAGILTSTSNNPACIRYRNNDYAISVFKHTSYDAVLVAGTTYTIIEWG